MHTFEVHISWTEKHQGTVEVKAESEDEAWRKAQDLARDVESGIEYAGDVVADDLTYEHVDGVDIDVVKGKG